MRVLQMWGFFFRIAFASKWNFKTIHKTNETLSEMKPLNYQKQKARTLKSVTNIG